MQPLLSRCGGATDCTKPDGQTPRKPGAYTRLLGLAIGVLLVLNGTLNAFLYKKLTPVYTATECGDQVATLDEFELGVGTIHVGLIIEVTCKNPNPYRIQILVSSPGDVYIGEDSLKVGSLTVVPGSHLEERGGGKVRVRMSADIEGDSAVSLMPHFLEDAAIPITMRLQFSVGISIPFGTLIVFETQAPFKKDCGMNLKGLLVSSFSSSARAQSRLGPLVCRDSFKALDIPQVGDVDKTPEDGQMGFTAAQVAPIEVARGELLKNVSLGLVITLSYLFAVLVPIRFWIVGPRCPTGVLKCFSKLQGSSDRVHGGHMRLGLEEESQPLREDESRQQEHLEAHLLVDMELGDPCATPRQSPLTPLLAGEHEQGGADAPASEHACQQRQKSSQDVAGSHSALGSRSASKSGDSADSAKEAMEAAAKQPDRSEALAADADDTIVADLPRRDRSEQQLSPQPSSISLRCNSSSTLPDRSAPSKWSLATSLNGLNDGDISPEEDAPMGNSYSQASQTPQPNLSYAAAEEAQKRSETSGEADIAAKGGSTPESLTPRPLEPPPPPATSALLHGASRRSQLAEAAFNPA